MTWQKIPLLAPERFAYAPLRSAPLRSTPLQPILRNFAPLRALEHVLRSGVLSYFFSEHSKQKLFGRTKNSLKIPNNPSNIQNNCLGISNNYLKMPNNNLDIENII